ncbi:MAG TPA: MOSC and FAD-binding oxidoreductase domain-containing protein [Conexibacter sp.]|jgi:ferredoxin-NADP reductase/MOSC domain-containing protein YiiM
MSQPPTGSDRRAVGRLTSVNVGLPRDVAWEGRTVYTGVWKQPVAGPQMVRRTNIDGDGQGDLNGHGGEQRAVLVYQRDSYDHWQHELGRDDFVLGQFGENFTVEGMPDDEVCVGDRYRIGEAELEVTQPRVTCYRVGLRMGEPRLPSLLVAHHRPGFYLRVIQEGHVEAGNEIVKTRSGPEALSVAAIDALLYLPGHDLEMLRSALRIPALSPGWQASFREMVEAAERGAEIAGGVGVAEQPAWPGFRRMRVTKVVPESPTVSSIYLADEGGAELPAAKAGQYLTVRAVGADVPAAVRSYSLSSSPEPQVYRLSVKREPHGVVSGLLHATLHAGSVLDVAAPRGEFTLAQESGRVVLISAGIGVTPVLAMLHELVRAGAAAEVWWIYVTHDATTHVFAREADELLASLPHWHEQVFYTGVDAGAPRPAGVVAGRPTPERLRALGIPADASAYICGPPPFMDEIGGALSELGLTPEKIHTELFSALPAITPGVTDQRNVPPHQPAGTPGPGPLVTFARSGLAVHWDDARRSLLELADACDVPTRWSCRTGVCQTCRTHALSGTVAYAPEPLEPPAEGDVLLCCSQPRGDVVLDL